MQVDPQSSSCYLLFIPAGLPFWTLGQIFINKVRPQVASRAEPGPVCYVRSMLGTDVRCPSGCWMRYALAFPPPTLPSSTAPPHGQYYTGKSAHGNMMASEYRQRQLTVIRVDCGAHGGGEQSSTGPTSASVWRRPSR